MKSFKIISLIVSSLVLILLSSCDKEEGMEHPKENRSSEITVKMTESSNSAILKASPGLSFYDEVNIDILKVSVHYGDTASSGEWVDLPTNAGIYNLMALQNALVVLANGGELPPGHITQMRLLLGNENTVVIDSVAFDLKTPSAQQSGLKINLDFHAMPGVFYEILLLFDANQSIVRLGNGGFLLKPVIRAEVNVLAERQHQQELMVIDKEL
ncbi:MAG: DUF4382 domain-containing protein [Bacteroidales bacterium]